MQFLIGTVTRTYTQIYQQNNKGVNNMQRCANQQRTTWDFILCRPNHHSSFTQASDGGAWWISNPQPLTKYKNAYKVQSTPPPSKSDNAMYDRPTGSTLKIVTWRPTTFFPVAHPHLWQLFFVLLFLFLVLLLLLLGVYFLVCAHGSCAIADWFGLHNTWRGSDRSCRCLFSSIL